MTTLHLYNAYKKLNCTHQELHENELSKSNAFYDYFTSIFTQDDLSPFQWLKIPHISVSVERIDKLLHNLKPHKATVSCIFSWETVTWDCTNLNSNLSILLVPGCTTCRMEVCKCHSNFLKGDHTKQATTGQFL